MTVKEALLAEVDQFSPSELMIEKALLDCGLTGTETYSTNVDLSKAELLVLKKVWYIQSESQGGVHLSFDKESLKARIKELANKTGEDVSSIFPTVKNASSRW